jgi:hypothetical protein
MGLSGHFSKEALTNDQPEYEQMLNITNHQENASQTHSGLSSHPI